AGVAGSWWNVHVAESGLAEDSRIGHAVQRDAAAEAEIGKAGLTLQLPREVDENLFHDALDAGCDIGAALAFRCRKVDRIPRIPRRPQSVDELARPALSRTLVIVEIREIERDPAVRSAPHDPPEQILERGASVGGETHHLVLALVHGKAEIRSERRIEHAQRVREAQLARDPASRLRVSSASHAR